MCVCACACACACACVRVRARVRAYNMCVPPVPAMYLGVGVTAADGCYVTSHHALRSHAIPVPVQVWNNRGGYSSMR